MSKELGIFIDYLKKKDLKLTDQRKIILDVFLKTERHLSVEDLYSIAKKKDHTRKLMRLAVFGFKFKKTRAF